MDLGRRLHAQVLREKSRCGGQRAVECGDDPAGGLSTLSAHQMAHGGVVPHSSSSELSAHHLPARDDRCKRYLAMMATVIPGRRTKTGKGRVPGHMTCLPLFPLDHHLQRYGRVARCVHGQWLRLHQGERYGVSYKTRLGKAECEDTRCVFRTSSRSSPSFQRGLSWGLGLLGQTRKPLGRVRLLHLSSPRGAQHDARADPSLRFKAKRTRPPALHDSLLID